MLNQLMILNPAKRARKRADIRYPRRGPMIASGTYETGVSYPPLMYIERVVRKGDFGLIAFGAYSAFGLIGPEQGGVALVSEKHKSVVGTKTIPYDPRGRDAEITAFLKAARGKTWFNVARERGYDLRYSAVPNPYPASANPRRPFEGNPGRDYHQQMADHHRRLAALAGQRTTKELGREDYEAAHDAFEDARYHESARQIEQRSVGASPNPVYAQPPEDFSEYTTRELSRLYKRVADALDRKTGAEFDETVAWVKAAAKELSRRRRKSPRKRSRKAKNPGASKGYKTFHGRAPKTATSIKVPKGFPRKLWKLGKHARTILKSGEILRGGTVAAGSGNTIYLLGVRAAGNGPAKGRVAQIEYTPQKNSARHGPTYFHTYKSPPAIRRAGKGFYIIRGARQKLTSRGIVG
jgi:hypothetical protein